MTRNNFTRSNVLNSLYMGQQYLGDDSSVQLKDGRYQLYYSDEKKLPDAIVDFMSGRIIIGDPDEIDTFIDKTYNLDYPQLQQQS